MREKEHLKVRYTFTRGDPELEAVIVEALEPGRRGWTPREWGALLERVESSPLTVGEFLEAHQGES